MFGRNTTAGLVNVITKKPELVRFGGSLDASYGNYNAIQATGAVNIPAGENVAFRAAANYEKRDSYLRQGTSLRSLDPIKDNLSRGSAFSSFRNESKAGNTRRL